MGNETNRRATAAEKRKQALELRRAGLTYDDIAAAVGYANKSVAYKSVKAAIADITRESAQELLSLELERLDDMQAGLYKGARSGDPAAVDRVLKIIDQRARFLGLYDRKVDDTSAEVRAALRGFMDALGLKFGPDDLYGQVSDGGDGDVPSDGELG